MRPLWQDIHGLERAVDEAFDACKRSMGTADFPRHLATFREASERLGALRVDLAIEQERQRRRQARPVVPPRQADSG